MSADIRRSSASVVWNSSGVKLHSPTVEEYKDTVDKLRNDASIEWSLDLYNTAISSSIDLINIVPSLVSLGMFKCSLTAERVSRSLQHNKTLVAVWIDNCSIGSGLQHLYSYLVTSSALKTVWITNDSTVNDKTIKYLGQALSVNKVIKQVSLHGCDVGDVGLGLLMNCIRFNKTLASLSLACNRRITSSSAGNICEMMKTNSTINDIHLFETSLTDSAVYSLCQLLLWSTSANRVIIFSQSHLEYCNQLSFYDKIKDKISFS